MKRKIESKLHKKNIDKVINRCLYQFRSLLIKMSSNIYFSHKRYIIFYQKQAGGNINLKTILF